MKVQLIVVQGRPEGKVIPLVGPVLKIGRGETCHLRPNSEQVSREHAQFTLNENTVTVQDLGSRNGTLVNGKAITAPCALKDRDLVQVGPLTFAVSIEGAPASVKPSAPPRPVKATPEDVSHDEIDSWLVTDGKTPSAEKPVYGGETITIAAFKDAETVQMPVHQTQPTAGDDSDEEYERLSEGAGDEEEEEEANEDDAEAPAVEEYVDESNPFYVKKKGPEPATPVKPKYADTSDAASDILRKMMERRKSR